MLLQKGILLPILASKITITTIQSYLHNALSYVVALLAEVWAMVGPFTFQSSISVVFERLIRISSIL